MTSENFVYWLKGYLELTEKCELSAEQIIIVKERLKCVDCQKMEQLFDNSVCKSLKQNISLDLKNRTGGNFIKLHTLSSQNLEKQNNNVDG